MKNLIILLLLLWAHVLYAGPPPETTPEPLVPSPEIDSELLEPEVTLIEREDQMVYEYRVNGQIYMIKIQPKNGPAYYLLDMDGDGDMDVQGDDPTKIVIPQWVFFRW